ncbi:hypothetical protein SLE2022_003820 [Rubroshorea leprosula]
MTDIKDCGNQKGCDHHHHDDQRRKRILMAILAFILGFGFVIFLVWVILQPHAPQFILQDATVYAFNLSEPNSLSVNMQVTLSSRNPNERIGIFYDRLDIYATYRNQQITLPTLLPCSYQGHKDITLWSPYLLGNAVPVSPLLSAVLSQDMSTGMVLMNIKVDGGVKWKVGTWISGKYHINVNCPAYISWGDHSKGVVPVGPPIKFQLVQHCTVGVSAS